MMFAVRWLGSQKNRLASERISIVPETNGGGPDLSTSLQQPECEATDARFDAAYDAHFTFVWRCLRSLGVPASQLDDAAQEVFLVVHRRFDSFEGASSFRTWLFGIVRRVAFNQRRTVQRRAARSEQLDDDFQSSTPGPHENAQAMEAAVFVERFLAGLDQKKREVFALAVLEEFSVPEVSEALNIPLNTAYTRLRRAREDFRRALEGRQSKP